jgi:hypothetical protein
MVVPAQQGRSRRGKRVLVTYLDPASQSLVSLLPPGPQEKQVLPSNWLEQ